MDTLCTDSIKQVAMEQMQVGEEVQVHYQVIVCIIIICPHRVAMLLCA